MLTLPGGKYRKQGETALGLGAFILGVATGGLLTGTVLVAIGSLMWWLPSTLGIVAFVIVAIWLGAIETGTIKARLPQSHRMIQPTRFHQSTGSGFFLFGLELGLGFRTYIPRTGPYLLASATVLLVSSWQALLLLAFGWGLGRSIPLIIQILANPSRPPVGGDRGVNVLGERMTMQLARFANIGMLLVSVPFAVQLAGS